MYVTLEGIQESRKKHFYRQKKPETDSIRPVLWGEHDVPPFVVKEGICYEKDRNNPQFLIGT